MKRALIVIGAALVLMVGGAIAYAAIPSSTGVFTGCVQKSSGSVRIIDAAKTSCSNTEQTVTWNQQGQPGTPGTNGTNGVSGYSEAFRTVSFAGNVEPSTPEVGVIVSCPDGTSVLGAFSNVVLQPAGGLTRGLAPSRYFPEVFQNKQSVHFDFNKPDGSLFGPGDALNGLVFVKCAATN